MATPTLPPAAPPGSSARSSSGTSPSAATSAASTATPTARELLADGELSSAECKTVIDDLAAFQVPAVLFSGGEPTTRKDLFDLAEYATGKGLRLTLSTNGTLITAAMAATIKRIGFTYVGISLDGIGAINDKFRGVEGAFTGAVAGIRNCKAVGQRVGLRMTLTDHNIDELPAIFDFVEAEGIDRVCFYHLVYSGRGGRIRENDLTLEKTRWAVDTICDRTCQTRPGRQERRGPDRRQPRGRPVPAAEAPPGGLAPTQPRSRTCSAATAAALSSSGVGIGNIDFVGNVHPDQFWMHYTLGNVRQRPFSQIWQDESEPAPGRPAQPGRQRSRPLPLLPFLGPVRRCPASPRRPGLR